MTSRLLSLLAALALLAFTGSAAAQVVETDPAPPRTDQSLTLTFYADRGNEGLKDCDCDVYVHTGLVTSESDNDSDWQYVMDNWPDNRPLTQLTQVAPNTYEITIDSIRGYYSQNRTGAGNVPPKDAEVIEKMAMVFRNADGTQVGKTANGGDIFVDVNDVGSDTPFVAANVLAPSAEPLFPFITATDTTVTVSVSADTANVDAFTELRLFVDSTEVASSTSTTLDHPLTMDTPSRFNVRVEAEATAGGSTVTDTTRTFLIRTPPVVEEPLPSGVDDGITYNEDGSVTLSLNAPMKEFAYVLGDFNDWAIDPDYFMKKDGPHWWLTLPASEIQSQTEYAFQYFVDGQHRIADPFSHKVLTPNDGSIPEATYPDLKAYPDSLTEGFVSVLETDQPDFNFSSFTPPPQDQMVVYELLVRDFLEESNYQTLTDTLDYLDRLGVNAIELMPVAEFGGNNSWGYNPTFHLALDKAYGTRRKFKEFVEAAHNRGIAVIMDVVYNHIDSQSPFRQLYSSAEDSPFLESNDDPPCSIFFEELDQSNPFIQNYIDRANRYWVEEFNVDGFRYDLAHCIADGGGDTVEGWKDVADYVWDEVDGGTAPFTYMILEFFGTNAEKQELANYRDNDAGGMPSWVGSTLNDAYSQSSMGFFNENANIEPAFFGFANFNDPSYMPYMESHDEQWLMQKNAQFGRSADNGYDIQELPTALDRQKLVGAFFFTLPGPRMTWQFAELGYGFRPDECLEDDGGDGICGPEAPGRTAPKPIRWEYRDPEQSPDRVDVYKTWQALLRLRNDNPDLFAKDPGIGNPEQGIKMIANTGDGVRCIRLRDENLDATIVGNFGVTPFDATLAVGTDASACSFSETGTWYNFFEDKPLQVDGPTSFQLRPGEFRIYTSEEQPAPPMGLVPSAPLHRSTQTVNADGTVDFGDTGVDIAFSGVSGSGDVTVETLIEDPIGPDGVQGVVVDDLRYVITADGDLSFDATTEVRLDASTLSGVSAPDSVTVYRRSEEDVGPFGALPTTFESGPGEIVATTDTFSEFVLGVNAPLPPSASDDSYTTPEGQTLSVAAPGVLANDTDPNGDSLTASLVSDVSNGSLTLDADGAFTYTPTAGFTGTDSFTYEASDGDSTAQATASIQVRPPSPITVDGRTDDPNYVELASGPPNPGMNFTGGVVGLKAHAGPDSLYIAVEGKLRAGQGDGTFREMMLFLNGSATDGVDSGTPLPPGSDGLSPFIATDGMIMDADTDYGIRITGGDNPQAFVSIVDYVSFAPGDDNAQDAFEGTVPSLDGTPVTGGATGGTYAYRDTSDLASATRTGFELALPYSAIGAAPGDAFQFFAFYGDVEGDALAATLLPDDGTDATYGNSEDWTAVPGTQYTAPFDGGPPACPLAWSLDVTGSTAAGDTLSTTLGQSASATAGIDPSCGEEELPPKPPGAYDLRFTGDGLSGVDLGNGSLTDVRPTDAPTPASAPSAPAIWRLEVQSDDYPVSFSWNDAALADSLPNVPVRLVDAATGGDLVHVDMKSTGSLVVENSSVTALEVRLDRDVTLTPPLADGWNLLSIPLDVSDPTFGAVLPSCASGFFYEPGSGYASIADGQAVPPGRGFFANCTAGPLDLTGTVPDTLTVPVQSGWNIIGPFADSVRTSTITTTPSGIVQSNFFSFAPSSGYTASDTLAPAAGYWVKTSQDGTLDLSGTSGSGTAPVAATPTRSTTNDGSASRVRLVVGDASGRSATLRLTESLSSAERMRSALPPKPPGSVFDVRFASGSAAAAWSAGDDDAPQGHDVEVQGATGPLTLRAEGLTGDRTLQVTDAATGGSVVDARLTADASTVTVPDGAGTLHVVATAVPAEFALEKSYPNPAASQATIEYALPDDASVTIELYDVLGRRVAQVVNREQRAGVHRVQVDVEDLSAGVYFYRMRAGDFTDTRRLTVVR